MDVKSFYKEKKQPDLEGGELKRPGLVRFNLVLL